MAYTAPSSARVWNTPMGGTVHCMDPRTHNQDNHGAQGYKTNQEVRPECLTVLQSTNPD